VTSPPAEPESLIQRVVGWLRGGYPEGIPRQDYVALLGLLQRALTPTEVDRVVQQLSEASESGEAIITPALVQQHIEDIVKGPAVPEDVARVSARLAAAGWPLWSPLDASSDEPPAADPDVRGGVTARVVDWLREGYPAGMPTQDFIPLIALLRRRLSDAEVTRVGRDLVRQGVLPADRADVGDAIAKVTSELPSEEDIGRVREYLSAHGWPVDFSV
jgi:uncharacterized protein (DUF2267 family)